MDFTRVFPAFVQIEERRTGIPRWVAMGAFVEGPHGEPLCIEYRVKMLPGATAAETSDNYSRMVNHMIRAVGDGIEPDADLSELGIPRYVFEEATQRRLLETARAALEEGRVHHPQPARLGFLQAPSSRRPGRPPQRPMQEKLRILAAVESAFEEGRPLQRVADDHHMSRSALRDLLSWARRDASPALFTSLGHGVRGGQLTPAARELLAQLDRQD